MNSEVKMHAGGAEFAEIESEINDLESYFGDLGLDDDDQESASDELSELNSALVGTEFSTEAAESAGPQNFLDLADGVGEQSGEGEELFGIKIPNPAKWVAKRLARKLIKFALKFVRKAAKYRRCLPKVVAAIAAFKAGKYGTAVKYGYSAGKCIRAQF